MKPGDIIGNTLTSLKNRLEPKGHLQLQVEGGYLYFARCVFYDPVLDYDLEQFMQKINVQLPVDYIQFLKNTNGCKLFDDVKFGGEAVIFSLKVLIKFYDENNNGYLKIACIYQDNIYIDLKSSINRLPNYIMIGDHQEYRPLNMNFELWFDRLVVSQGAKFWEWTWDSAEHYYKRRR
jgi:hypothetical protein